jgi:hypothetical protein
VTSLGLVLWALWVSEPNVPLHPAAYFQTEEGCYRAAIRVENRRRRVYVMCVEGDYMPPPAPTLPKGKVTL